MKVHIGSGSIYLLGYLNIDVKGNRTWLSSQRPDLVERYATKEEDYYGRHQSRSTVAAFASPLDQEYVCDKFGDFTHIPVATGTATEVLARQSFEHLSYTEARAALDQLEDILAPDGILRLDVPDHDETLRLLRSTGDDFYARHLYGTQRDAHGYHVMSYTRSALIGLAESVGFKLQSEEPNIHPYPAFCLRFIKSELPAPREYALPPYPFEPGWKIADIGPGAYPLPAATAYIDINRDNLKRIHLSSTQQTYHIGSLERGLAGWADKEFDYIFCSHVLEHVDDPAAVVSELSRIGKRGTIVMPSAIKEAIFNFEESTHQWLVLPHPRMHDFPIFVRRSGNASYKSVLDPEVQHVMCRLYRTGPNRHEEGAYLRRWYKKHEPELDVIIHWEDHVKVMVID